MNGFMNFMETKVVPVANKVGSQKHLLAIRDALIGMISVTMMGSFAVLINNLGAVPQLKWYADTMKNVFGENWKMLGGNIWWGTFVFMAVFALFAVSLKLARAYGDDGVEAMCVAAACYFILLPQSTKVTIEQVVDGKKTELVGSNWGIIHWSNFQATSLFAALLIGIIATEVFIKLSKVKYLIIKMPEGVPPAVGRAFAKLLPGMATITIFGIISVLFTMWQGTDMYFNKWLDQVLVSPFSEGADSLWFAVLLVFLVHAFWFVGLHGPNILGGIITPLMTKLGAENTNIYEGKQTGEYAVFAGAFLDAFVYLGGSGATLGLLIAMVITRSKRKEMIALGLPPGLFQINEPVLFGMPMVLNVLFAVPFILTPIVLTVISYLAVQSGLVAPVVASIPWVAPAGLGGWLATGGRMSGLVLALSNLAISIVIYLPFVIAYNRQLAKQQAEANSVNM